MKTAIKLMVLLGVFIWSDGQSAINDTINQVDSLGQKYGHWIIRGKDKNHLQEFKDYADTAKVEEGRFENGERNGTWKWYFDNGNLRSVAIYIDNKIEGPAVTYYINGNKNDEGYWKDNGWEGIFRYFRENGDTAYVLEFKDGKRVGKPIISPSPQHKVEGTWRGGRPK